jgi:hypothetical protein
VSVIIFDRQMFIQAQPVPHKLICRQILVKPTNIKFNDIPSSDSRVPCGRTDGQGKANSRSFNALQTRLGTRYTVTDGILSRPEYRPITAKTPTAG